MSEVELWLSIFSAFAVGFGLGWWWFSGSSGGTDDEPGSAQVARDRVARDTHDTAPTTDSPELQQLRAELDDTRAELSTLRHEAERARSERSDAQFEVAAGRSHLASIQASLDQARSDRDSLRSELELAERAMRALRASAEEAAATAAAEAEARAQAARAPTSAPAPAPEPSPPAPDPTDLPTPGDAMVLGSTASIQLPRPPPPSKRARSPIDVLFGPLGGVPLTTSARSIPWELTLRLRETDGTPSRLTDLQVTLRFDLEDEGLSINGRRRGPLTVNSGASLVPGRPLHIQVSLSTGVHSDTVEADRPPALPGEHRVIIAVQYRVERSTAPPSTVRFSAHIPVIPAEP